jgi:hypothetical protein
MVYPQDQQGYGSANAQLEITSFHVSPLFLNRAGSATPDTPDYRKRGRQRFVFKLTEARWKLAAKIVLLEAQGHVKRFHARASAWVYGPI